MSWKLTLNHTSAPILIPDVLVVVRRTYTRRCTGDALKRPRVCALTGRPYVVLLCVGMRDATGKCDAVRLPCTALKLFGTVYRLYTSRTEITRRISKDIFAFLPPVIADGINPRYR